jgi:hypothetical protein
LLFLVEISSVVMFMLASKSPWSVSVTMSSLLISQVDSEVVVFCRSV